jgi:hypothetical protein
VRGELFPCGDDFGDFPSVDWLDQSVNVIGHDNPSEKPVAQRVEIQEGGLDDSSRNRVTESAASVSGIDPSFEAFAALRVPLGIRKKDDFAVKPLDRLLRDAVGEMIGDVLQGAGRIKVRQVAAAVPSRIAGSAIRRKAAFFFSELFGVHVAVGPKRRRAGQATGAPGKTRVLDPYGDSPNKKPRLKSRGALSYNFVLYHRNDFLSRKSLRK